MVNFFHALALVGTLAFLAAEAGAVASAADGVVRGAAIAQRLCAPCHAVGRAGASPNPDAPPFRMLEARLTLEGVEDVLAEELALGHDPMPPWSFTDERLLDLVDYIASLGRDR